MSKLVTRKEWKAQRSKGAFRKMTKCAGVVFHYPGDNTTYKNHASCVAKVQQIQNMHLHNKVEDYLDIAYNLAVCEHDYIFILRDRNVCSGANGTTASNLTYYAVLVLIPIKGTMSNTLKRAALNAVTYLKAGSVPVGSKRLGHKDIHATGCPGKSVYSWVQAGCPAPASPNPPPKPTPKPPVLMAKNKPIGVAPGKTHPQVKQLDIALTRAGFKVAEPSTYYGKSTSDAVAKFHNAYPKYRSRGKNYDPAIGVTGWRKLRSIAY